MLRNFKHIMKLLEPKMIIFVGDLMDGGREWEDAQYAIPNLGFRMSY